MNFIVIIELGYYTFDQQLQTVSVTRNIEDIIVDNRPVNLDFRTIRMPLKAILSILHRITGILIFLGMPVLLWMFGKSLSSATEFQQLQLMLDQLWFRLLFIAILAAFAYHIIAGIKHLFMDHGIGDTEGSAKIATWLLLIFSLIAFGLLGTQI